MKPGLLIAPLLLCASSCAGSDAATCGKIDGCGGELTGTWKVAALCGEVGSSRPGTLRLPFGSGWPAQCPPRDDLGPLHSASREVVDAYVEFTANGRYLQSGTVGIRDTYVLTAACVDAITSPSLNQTVLMPATARKMHVDSCDIALSVGASFNADGVRCSPEGDNCRCQTTQVLRFDATGYYRTENTRIFFDFDAEGGEYCAPGATASLLWHSTAGDDSIELMRDELGASAPRDAAVP